MPKLQRNPVRMDCLGLDLAHPVDRMPPGYFPYIYNVRVLEEGRIDPRPGYSVLMNAAGQKALNSIRRLNDIDESHAPAGYIYVLGNGTALDAGIESNPVEIDTGYSGNPLSLITFRPNNSPESWMYVYDQNKQVKVDPGRNVRQIGVTPANTPPAAEYGTPAAVVINEGFSNTGWTGYNGAGAPANSDRTSGTSTTIGSILYNSPGTGPGWCCIVPTPGSGHVTWAGERMRIVLNSGGGNAETVAIREIHAAIAATTIQGIQYDSGTTGLCSIVLAAFPTNLTRNSLLTIGSELVRVLSVVLAPDGITYSIRCSTTVNHAAGASVTGQVSWYCYTTKIHVATETITAGYISSALSAAAPIATPASIAVLESVNASTAGGRPVSTANDYLHISLFLGTPANVIQITLQIDIDANTTTVGSSGNAFTNNYWTWTILPDQLNLAQNGWTEITIPISSGVRTGIDLTRTFANIMAVQIQVVTTGACNFGFDGWYFMGTYGPTVPINSPVGIQYVSVNRDSSTGAASLPSPQTRYQLFPLREAVLVSPATSLQTGVDSLDIYRFGNTLAVYTYDGTVLNSPPPGVANVYTDTQPDAVIAANPAVDTTLVQPWPILDLPWSGIVNVVGTSVTWVSGTQFNLNLIGNTVITINGTSYQIQGNPKSATFLELQASAGVLFSATYQIQSPTLANQPMPYAFGTLEGPFAPVLFGLGDPKNPGTLYYTNTANLDAASDQNTLEVCPPSEPLISGDVWNGFCILGSRDNIFIARYSYLTTLGIAPISPNVYQFNRLPSASGMWSRWTCVRGPDGVYFLGRDGIYKATDAGSVNISDAQLYPLFPHDGQQAETIENTFASPIPPVNMQAGGYLLRLSCCDQDIYFDYVDTANNNVTLRYEIPKKRWFLHYYGDGTGISQHYLDESSSGVTVNNPNPMRLLLLSRSTGLVYLSGGEWDDAGTGYQCLVNTPSYDLGDQRAAKLWVEAMTDMDGTGPISGQIFYENNTVLGAGDVYGNSSGLRQQYVTPLTSIPGAFADMANPLAAYRNVSIKYSWFPEGDGGPRIYAFEPSGYLQPYVSRRIATQTNGLGSPGWKHHRRLYAGLLSTSQIVLHIYTQDGRTYTYTIPATGGLFRIMEQMLDQDIKDLAFAYEIDGGTNYFALFPEEFTIEVKDWRGDSYVKVPVFLAGAASAGE